MQPLLRRQSSLTVRISGHAQSEAGRCSPFLLVNIPHCCCHTGSVEFGFYAEMFSVIRYTAISLIGQIRNSLFLFVVAIVLVILTRTVSLEECIFCARKLQHVIGLTSAPYSSQELSPIFETILSLLQQCIKLI